ncbi:MAG: amidohydrolase family protein [Gammaproteobacteria bacterium]
MIIDVHTHFIPEPAIEAARAGEIIDGVTLESEDGIDFMVHPTTKMRYPAKRVLFDRDAKLQHMDDAGIDVSILSIMPPWLFHWTPADDAIDYCRNTNDWLSEFSADSDRLLGMATVPLQSPEAAAIELRRCVTALGLHGVHIGTTVNGLPLDDEQFTPFFEVAEELAVPVTLHPCYSGKPSGLSDFFMNSLVGNPIGTTVAATRMILSGFLDRYPQLEIVLVHAGGYLPYQVGRLDQGCVAKPEMSAAIDKRPSEYLRRFHYDTLTFSSPQLKLLIELVGHDRVLHGTDLPAKMGDTDSKRILDEADLTAEARIAIECENAKQLFRLE